MADMSPPKRAIVGQHLAAAAKDFTPLDANNNGNQSLNAYHRKNSMSSSMSTSMSTSISSLMTQSVSSNDDPFVANSQYEDLDEKLNQTFGKHNGNDSGNGHKMHNEFMANGSVNTNGNDSGIGYERHNDFMVNGSVETNGNDNGLNGQKTHNGCMANEWFKTNSTQRHQFTWGFNQSPPVAATGPLASLTDDQIKTLMQLFRGISLDNPITAGTGPPPPIIDPSDGMSIGGSAVGHNDNPFIGMNGFKDIYNMRSHNRSQVRRGSADDNHPRGGNGLSGQWSTGRGGTRGTTVSQENHQGFHIDSRWTPLTNPMDNQEQYGIKRIRDAMSFYSFKATATYTWTGQLPARKRIKNPIYSTKVFLGGIPYDLTDGDLHCTFAPYGPIEIQWPGKDVRSAIDGATANKAGYVYVIFETCDKVTELLNKCTVSYRDVETGGRWYYNISSRRQRGKEVQVIPFDIGDRFYMKSTFSGQMEHSRTVFVGALHGMLSAEGLAKVIDDLFGGVVFAGLDTDKHKYPLGSGRVTFDNQESYLKAVKSAFIEIKAARFRKKIQIDPYIENESVCAVCRRPQSMPIFCRDDFKYFCVECWDSHLQDPDSTGHRPIVKNKPNAP